MQGKCFWSETRLSPGSISACVARSRDGVRCYCSRGRRGSARRGLALAAMRRGRELGLVSLSARGSELERDFAYGMVRQLFEAPLIAEIAAGAGGAACRRCRARGAAVRRRGAAG